jgi:hypothetical protein
MDPARMFRESLTQRCYRSHCGHVCAHVRFAPKATKLLHRHKMSRSAINLARPLPLIAERDVV